MFSASPGKPREHVLNSLTRTASKFDSADDQVRVTGLLSTNYQQTDDTSARVASQRIGLLPFASLPRTAFQ